MTYITHFIHILIHQTILSCTNTVFFIIFLIVSYHGLHPGYYNLFCLVINYCTLVVFSAFLGCVLGGCFGGWGVVQSKTKNSFFFSLVYSSYLAFLLTNKIKKASERGIVFFVFGKSILFNKILFYINGVGFNIYAAVCPITSSIYMYLEVL